MIGAARSGELGELSPPLSQEQNDVAGLSGLCPPLSQEQNESELEICSSSSMGKENRWSGHSKVGFREEGEESSGCLGMEICALSRVLKMCPT
jgi:hypothetical protein